MSTTQTSKNGCPKCGASIPEGSPHGLCAACLLAGAATETDAGLKPGERITPPPLEAVRAAFPELEIVDLIGIGGMSVVYKARQSKLDRTVALKLLPLSHSADPAFAERFHREARFLARLQHPNIVSVYDFGQAAGFYYLLLEFVDGVNLRQAMRAGHFSQAEALGIVPRICDALQYAHDHGVLHRDIKPENILLDARGQVKLADFGIAKVLAGAAGATGDVTLTQSGSRLGTAHYMAPEQIEKPSDVDHRADIYSLGVVFYELLTGELPLGRFSPPSEKFDIDSRVDAIVFRALSKEREFRQQSAGEVKTDVEGLGVAAGGGGRRETPNPLVAVNPWPNRLGYLILGMVALPVSAVMAALIVPVLSRNGVGWASLLAGLLPTVTGAALVFGYRQGVKKCGKATPIAEWNPWPRRVFIILAVGVILPAVFLMLGLIVPMLTATRYVAGPPVSGMAKPEAIPGQPQLFLASKVAKNDELVITWKVVSKEPASVRLAHGAETRDFALQPQPGENSYALEISGNYRNDGHRFEARLSVKDGQNLAQMSCSWGAEGSRLTGMQDFQRWVDQLPSFPPLGSGAPMTLATFGSDAIILSLVPGGSETNRATPAQLPPMVESEIAPGHPQLLTSSVTKTNGDLLGTWKVVAREPASLRLAHGTKVWDLALQAEPGGHLYSTEITSLYPSDAPKPLVLVSVKGDLGMPIVSVVLVNPLPLVEQWAMLAPYHVEEGDVGLPVMSEYPFPRLIHRGRVLKLGESVSVAKAGTNEFTLSLLPAGTVTNQATPGTK